MEDRTPQILDMLTDKRLVALERVNVMLSRPQLAWLDEFIAKHNKKARHENASRPRRHRRPPVNRSSVLRRCLVLFAERLKRELADGDLLPLSVQLVRVPPKRLKQASRPPKNVRLSSEDEREVAEMLARWKNGRSG